MITYSNNSDSVIIVLHEIYGINQHMKLVCENYNRAGFDVICPDLFYLIEPFDYSDEEKAYQYFIKNVGFNLAAEQIRKLIAEVKPKYKHVFLLGFSIGATLAWLCSDGDIGCDGIIGYYGSRIRDYLYINPKCRTLLIFPNKEKSFSVGDLLCTLKKKANVDAHMLNGNHGFCDPFSSNYNDEAFRAAEKLVSKQIRDGSSKESVCEEKKLL